MALSAKSLSLLWLSAALVLALVSPAVARVVNRVVATVDGSPITLYQFEQYVGHNTGGMKASQLTDEQKEEVLEGLITDSLITMQADKLGLHVSGNDVEAYIQQIMVANDLDQATLYAALEQQGLDADGYRNQIRRELLKNQLVSRDIRDRVNITDEEVQRYYEKNGEQFAVLAAVELSHILFILPPNPTEADMQRLADKARRAHQRLVSGESFVKVAREMSDAPDADGGGKIGRIEKGQMMTEIENVAFVLPEGEISHPVRSPAGLHILKVENREIADAVPLDQVRDQIKERLYGEAIQERFDNWADEDLRAGHAIEIRI
jgi:peptidyl-prolyl cis-trans isomerase SurA